MVPLVSLRKGPVLVGRGPRPSGEGIARSGQITVKPPMSRLGRAGERGEDPPGVSCPHFGACEGERRAEVPLFPAVVLGPLGSVSRQEQVVLQETS